MASLAASAASAGVGGGGAGGGGGRGRSGSCDSSSTVGAAEGDYYTVRFDSGALKPLTQIERKVGGGRVLDATTSTSAAASSSSVASPSSSSFSSAMPSDLREQTLSRRHIFALFHPPP